MGKEPNAKGEASTRPGGIRRVRDWLPAAAITAAIFGALYGVRAFAVEAFKLPSGSMLPTLDLGDHVWVKKSAYGFLSHKLPDRSDVIVFEYPDPDPRHPRQDFIKRVVAMPGDVLTVDNGQPLINGWPIPRCRLGEASLSKEEGTPSAELFVEFLAGHAYLVALFPRRHDDAPLTQGPYTVAPNEVFVLGDNRDNSADSRTWNHGRGAGVPLEKIKGRASSIWLPTQRFGISLDGAPVLPPAAASLEPALKNCLAHAPAAADTMPPRAK